MFDNFIMPGEDAGEQAHENAGELDPVQAARASEWETAMQDGVSEFAGEWSYGEQQDFAPDSDDISQTETFEQDITPDQNLAGAGRITSYGFDTASRIYGLSNVLTQIYDTDITADGVVQNPLGAIYEKLEPNPESRAYLFREIQKDTVVDNEQNDDPNLNTARTPLGITPYGDFYDKKLVRDNDHNDQTSINAIVSLKKLLDSLASEPRFEPLRQRAAEQHKSIIDLLVGDATNPTITIFLNGVGGELSNASVEEITNEIEERAETALSEEEDELGVVKDLEDESNIAETEDYEAIANDNARFESELVDRFNQSLGRETQPRTNPEALQDILSDDELTAILQDEYISNVANKSDSDSEAIFDHLKNQVPVDFEEAAKLRKQAKSGDLPH